MMTEMGERMGEKITTVHTIDGSINRFSNVKVEIWYDGKFIYLFDIFGGVNPVAIYPTQNVVSIQNPILASNI